MKHAASLPNKDLRRQIVEMVVRGRDGHIPSSFSIVDIVARLYEGFLQVDPARPDWPDRDYFILSKGHGCLALYVVLARKGFLTEKDITGFCTPGGILGEHPDATKVPGVEASTGSLGHGMPFAVGIALGLQIRRKPNRVVVLCGDGECHEGTIWEAAHVARNRRLGNLCVIVDWNGSGQQLMPVDDLPAKWRAFGWNTHVADGHDPDEIADILSRIEFVADGIPTAIIARTVKGKGVPLLEGHGPWHHRIPNPEELATIREALS
jgi:transketolase